MNSPVARATSREQTGLSIRLLALLFLGLSAVIALPQTARGDSHETITVSHGYNF